MPAQAPSALEDSAGRGAVLTNATQPTPDVTGSSLPPVDGTQPAAIASEAGSSAPTQAAAAAAAAAAALPTLPTSPPATTTPSPQPPRTRPQPAAPQGADTAETISRAAHEAEIERRVQQAQRTWDQRQERRVSDLVERRARAMVETVLGERESQQQDARLWRALDENDYLTLAEAKIAELQQRRASGATPTTAATTATTTTRESAGGRVTTGHLPAVATGNGFDHNAVVTEIWSNQVDPLLHALLQQVDDEARTQIGAKDYGEDPVGARATYLQDVLDAHARRAIVQARTRWEKEELPAAVSRRLSELQVEEPAVDLDGGAPVDGELTPERYSALTFEDRRALQKTNPEAITRMIRKHSGLPAT